MTKDAWRGGIFANPYIHPFVSQTFPNPQSDADP